MSTQLWLLALVSTSVALNREPGEACQVTGIPLPTSWPPFVSTVAQYVTQSPTVCAPVGDAEITPFRRAVLASARSVSSCWEVSFTPLTLTPSLTLPHCAPWMDTW